MAEGRGVKASGLVVMILLGLLLALPGLAQVPPAEEALPGPILRVTMAEVQVQGERTPESVREAFTAVLPAVADCLQAEAERAGKAPKRVMLRLNLGSNGKVQWSKVIDPPAKSLEACCSQALRRIQLPPSASGTISRATVTLEVRQDHLLTP